MGAEIDPLGYIHPPRNELHYEYGYLLDDGTEEWEINHGTDGAWTAWNSEHGIEAIDIYEGNEVAAIYAALDKAHVTGTALRRMVVVRTNPAEKVPRP